MLCMCHVVRKESSLTSGIVFSAGLKPEAPAPQFDWYVLPAAIVNPEV